MFHLHLPPVLALLLSVGLIVFLFRRDIRDGRQVTGALWIPLIWLLIIGSRFVSQWLGIFGFNLGPVSLEDGSPLDAAIFGLLIVSGLYVLYRRHLRLSEVIRNNRWMTFFLLYCLLSVLWSDFQFVALKRWIKVLGNPIMALIVLTEPEPEKAIIHLIKRCAYVWLPISIVFIKYFPQWGRTFDEWTGAAENTGITTNKNILGWDLFVVGALLFWHMQNVWRADRGRQRRNELVLTGFLLWMTGWLLNLAHSSTSLVSLLVALAIMVVLRMRAIEPRYIGIYLVVAALVAVVAIEEFDMYTVILRLLGKNPTLTDRTLLWQSLLQVSINPLFGTGFESFWLGSNLNALWDQWAFRPTEAHNEYLETYLNLGVVGLFLLLSWFLVTYRKARRDVINGFGWGRFRLAFLVALLFYNWTEAQLKGVNLVFFIYFLIAMDRPRSQSESKQVISGEDELMAEVKPVTI